jgi:hypothetical protein
MFVRIEKDRLLPVINVAVVLFSEDGNEWDGLGLTDVAKLPVMQYPERSGSCMAIKASIRFSVASYENCAAA